MVSRYRGKNRGHRWRDYDGTSSSSSSLAHARDESPLELCGGRQLRSVSLSFSLKTLARRRQKGHRCVRASRVTLEGIVAIDPTINLSPLDSKVREMLRNSRRERISEQFSCANSGTLCQRDTVIDVLIIYLECSSWTGSLLMIPHTQRCKGSDKYREHDMEYCTSAILKLGQRA